MLFDSDSLYTFYKRITHKDAEKDHAFIYGVVSDSSRAWFDFITAAWKLFF